MFRKPVAHSSVLKSHLIDSLRCAFGNRTALSDGAAQFALMSHNFGGIEGELYFLQIYCPHEKRLSQWPKILFVFHLKDSLASGINHNRVINGLTMRPRIQKLLGVLMRE